MIHKCPPCLYSGSPAPEDQGSILGRGSLDKRTEASHQQKVWERNILQHPKLPCSYLTLHSRAAAVLSSRLSVGDRITLSLHTCSWYVGVSVPATLLRCLLVSYLRPIDCTVNDLLPCCCYFLSSVVWLGWKVEFTSQWPFSRSKDTSDYNQSPPLLGAWTGIQR